MIIAKITSGLGNQLFQYAMARHLALKRNTSLYFDLGFYAFDNPNNTPRQFKLDQFNITYKTVSQSASIYWSKATKLFPNRSFNPLFAWLEEQQHHYNDAVLKTQAGCITVKGYWQSEKYFGDVADVIRRELTFKDSTDPRFTYYKQLIGATAVPVSVHVRRGDYVHHPEFSKTFGFVGVDYYQKAIQLMQSRYPTCVFFLFSDDKEWTTQHFNFVGKSVFIENIGSNSDIDDLHLMSLCKHNIIANSSYSWWGAWLNSNNEKTVIAPDRWYKNKPELNTSDLVPITWLKL